MLVDLRRNLYQYTLDLAINRAFRDANPHLGDFASFTITAFEGIAGSLCGD